MLKNIQNQQQKTGQKHAPWKKMLLATAASKYVSVVIASAKPDENDYSNYNPNP